jgi:hypothetical protein
LAVWSSINESAADAFTPWVLFFAHAVFGMTAGVLVARTATVSSAPELASRFASPELRRRE